MRILYFDCGMGADAASCASALLDLFDEKEDILGQLNEVAISGIRYAYQNAPDYGMELQIIFEDSSASSDIVPRYEAGNEEDLSRYADRMLEEIHLQEKVKEDVKKIVSKIAFALDAFGEKSGNPVEIFAQIVACSYMMQVIRPDKIISSPINVGRGLVEQGQKMTPIPCPSTMSLLKDIPIYQGRIGDELCSLTGAALMAYYVDEYENMPCMQVQRCGYGINLKGKFRKMFIVYQAEQKEGSPNTPPSDQITLIHANLDDMTGEAIGFAQEMLWQSGALDVYTTAINMKKNRPAVMLSCICKADVKEKCIDSFLRYTTTLGVRIENMDRRILERRFETKETAAGRIHVKIATHKGSEKWKAEYDDVRKIALERGVTLREAERFLNR